MSIKFSLGRLKVSDAIIKQIAENMSTSRLKEVRNFDLRLRANEYAPSIPGPFAPQQLFTLGPVKSPVDLVICDKIFMVLEPETFIPILARMFVSGDETVFEPLAAAEIGKSGLDMNTLPHVRSMNSGNHLWSFCLQENETLRLDSTDSNREFVFSGAIVLDYKERSQA